MGREEGVSVPQLQALQNYEDAPVFSEVERLALRLADAMTDTPVVVSDHLYAKLMDHLTEAQLVELSSAIAWEQYRARWNRVFELDAENFSAGAYCPMPVDGGASGSSR